METKQCSRCKEILPLTDDYFYKKKTKFKLVSGETRTCISYRYVCKKCNGKNALYNIRKKRYDELDCNESNYVEKWRRKWIISKLKYKELIDVSSTRRHYINEKIDSGYEFINIDKYEKDKAINFRNAQLKSRKYNYNNPNKLSRKEINDAQTKHITKSRVANWNGISSKDLPDDIYSIIKTNVLLKRSILKIKYHDNI